MASISALDERTGRKFFLDDPNDLAPGEKLVFLLNLHGGGSHGSWQRAYFPAHDYKERYRLVVASPSAGTREPFRHWRGEVDDEHLRNIVEHVVAKYGAQNLRAFWLVGHSQGGFTSQRLLNTDYFKTRVDGWLSLSGGRIGAAERASNAGPPRRADLETVARTLPARPPIPDCDFSFIFAVGEHEIASLPKSSPWAERYGAGPRVRLPDVVDTEPGQIWDTTREGRSTQAWGLRPRPGTAEVYVYPDARDRRVIGDVVRLDKGHTEGLEPRITDAILQLVVQEPGGKLTRAGG